MKQNKVFTAIKKSYNKTPLYNDLVLDIVINKDALFNSLTKNMNALDKRKLTRIIINFRCGNGFFPYYIELKKNNKKRK
jgi:hypothetical protein